MKIRIKVAESIYLIKSYNTQIMTAKELNSIDERTGRRTLSNRQYHANLEDALGSLTTKRLKNSTATTLVQLLDELKELHQTIKEVSNDDHTQQASEKKDS